MWKIAMRPMLQEDEGLKGQNTDFQVLLKNVSHLWEWD